MNDTEATTLAKAVNKECPYCYAPIGKPCNRAVIAEFEAFPVKYPPPWGWFIGPQWIHIHRERLL